MRKRLGYGDKVLLQMVTEEKSVILKMQNEIHRFRIAFLTLRASRVQPSSALSEL